MLTKFLLVALGGSIGAMLRYAISIYVPAKGGFPVATFCANVFGSMLIGIAYVFIVERALVSANYRELLVVGFLGALTTFSSFSLESINLIQSNQMQMALVYVVTSVIFCIVAAFLGASAARLF